MGDTKFGTLLGVGGSRPDNVVTTAEIMEEVNPERFGIRKTFIEDHLGIVERRVCDDECRASDLAIEAGQVAIENAGVDSKDIDSIIFCGIDSDWKEPSTAYRVAEALDINISVAFDLSNACNGFMTGVHMANCMIAAEEKECILVVTGERSTKVMYQFIDKLKKYKDKESFKRRFGFTSVGDGGGAMVIGKSTNGKGFKAFNTYTDPSLWKMCYYRNNQRGDIIGEMIMTDISHQIGEKQKMVTDKLYQKLGWTAADVDHMYTHQVGKKVHQETAEITGVPVEKTPAMYPNHGNLTTATIPLGMHLHPPKPGENIMFAGTGSGISVIQIGLTV